MLARRVLRQMLVCYESILTGESRAFLFRSYLLAGKGCDEKSQGSDCGIENARGRPLLENREKWRTPSYFGRC